MKQINTFVPPFFGMFTVSCNQGGELVALSRTSVVLKEFQFLNAWV